MKEAKRNTPLCFTCRRGLWGLISYLGLLVNARPSVYFMLAALCVVLESLSAFDQFFQKPFFSNEAWLISRSFHHMWGWLLYTWPKIIIGIIGVTCLIVFLCGRFLKERRDALAAWQKPALLVVLSISLVPSVVAFFKAITGIHVPANLLPYGGDHPHIGLIEQLWCYGHVAGGWGFPAGHASGGFALMSLYYLPLSGFRCKLLLGAGVIYGQAMGLYQMARGEHFLTHTLTSMFLAMGIIVLLAELLGTKAINMRD